MASLMRRLSARTASLLVLPSAILRSKNAPPGECAKRIWVIAAMWMAWLSCPLPRRESRWVMRPPEDTSLLAAFKSSDSRYLERLGAISLGRRHGRRWRLDLDLSIGKPNVDSATTSARS